MLYNISNELNASLCSDLISFQSIQSTWDSVCKNNAGQANIRAPNLYVGTAILQFVGNNSVYNCFFLLSTQKLLWHFLTHSILLDIRHQIDIYQTSVLDTAIAFSKMQIKLQGRKNAVKKESLSTASVPKLPSNHYLQTLPEENVMSELCQKLHYKRNISLLMSVIRKSQPGGTHWVKKVPAFVELNDFWVTLKSSQLGLT